MSTLGFPQTMPPLLVGRDRELSVLREQLARTVAGQGSLVLIGGEAGIGKTALAEVLCREATEQGALVLTGRCFDLTETPPYGPWVELFAHYRRPADGPQLPTTFAERGTVGAVASQFVLFQQVLDFFTALSAGHPIVLLLDDLHWGEAASLDLLRFISRNAATLPIVVIATYRADELTRHHPLYQLIPVLVREASAVRIDLHPLHDDAVRTLVDARYRVPVADTVRLVAYLHARAEGNALFVGELLRSLEEIGALRRDHEEWHLGSLSEIAVPTLLRQVIDTRCARLDAESQRLLAVAAIIGHEVPLATWSAVAAADEAAVLAAAERGLETHLLAEAPGGAQVQFAHALIREALYESIPAVRRRHLHLRVADALIAAPGPDPDAVAYHLQQASDPRAVTWLREAGERAQRAWAWLAAADSFEAALTLMDDDSATVGERGWLLFRLATLRRYGDTTRALAHLDVAGQLAAETQDALLAAQVRFRRGHIRSLAGDTGIGLAEMAAGVAALEALPPIDAAARPGIGLVDLTEARAGYCSHLGYTGRLAEALALGEHVAAETAAAAPDGTRSIEYGTVVNGLATVYAYLGRGDEARQLFATALSAWRALDFHLQVGITTMWRLIWETLPYHADDVAERRRLATEAEEAWARGGGGRTAMPDRFARTPVLFVEGHWDEVRTLALAGHRESGGYAVGTAFAFATLGPLAQAQGDRELAQWLIREWLPDGPATSPGTTIFTATLLQRMAAAMAVDRGDLETARAWLDALDHWFAWSGAVLGQAERHLAWAEYHRAAHEMELAFPHAERALACASNPRQPLALIAAHRMLGALETSARRYDDAARHLVASLTFAEACEAPYERALTLLAEAALRAHTGERDTAIRLLDEVRPIFAALDAKPALTHAEALAAHLDAAKETVPAYPAGLSAREVEVLRLVVDGLSNGDIADRLFLSKRTVQVHVAHILQKTGAENRAGAAAFALRHGLA